MATNVNVKFNDHWLRIDEALRNFLKSDNNDKNEKQNKNKNNVRSALGPFPGPRIMRKSFGGIMAGPLKLRSL